MAAGGRRGRWAAMAGLAGLLMLAGCEAPKPDPRTMPVGFCFYVEDVAGELKVTDFVVTHSSGDAAWDRRVVEMATAYPPPPGLYLTAGHGSWIGTAIMPTGPARGPDISAIVDCKPQNMKLCGHPDCTDRPTLTARSRPLHPPAGGPPPP